MLKKTMLSLCAIALIAQPIRSEQIGTNQTEQTVNKRDLFRGTANVLLGAGLFHMGFVIGNAPACLLAAVCAANGAYNIAISDPRIEKEVLQFLANKANKLKHAKATKPASVQSRIDQLFF